MLEDTLNETRWTGKRHRGFYEVWYLTAVDPETKDAYWFRYTIDAPYQGNGEAELGLWALVTPANDPKSGLVLHDKIPIAKFTEKSTEDKGFKIEIGKYGLERNKATGKVGTGDRCVEWDLKWEQGKTRYEPVSPALEKLGISKSSMNSANLSIALEGTIKVGAKTIKVGKWPGEQSHTWGKKHADSWAWAHCNLFDDATATFDGFAARVRKLGVLLPPAVPLWFKSATDEFASTDLTSIWSNRSTVGRYRWSFEAEGNDTLLRGTVSAPPEKFIAVEYKDPDGELLYCHHASTADMTLDVYKRVGFRWEKSRTLSSKGTTAFEITSRERMKDTGRALDLVDARIFEEEPPKPAPAPPKPAAPAPAPAAKT